jgi:GT2 family glycosyltransferase
MSLSNLDFEKSENSEEKAVEMADERDTKIEELTDKVKALTSQKEHLEKYIEGILNSRSWKITAGFRKIFAGVRSFFPLLRFSTINLRIRELINISKKDGVLFVDRAGPQIILNSENGVLPRGWVYIKTDLDSSKFPAFFLFYFGRDGNFNPLNRVWLTIPSKFHTSNIFRIPEWVTDLRLDPFNLDSSFSLEKFEVHQIGKLQLLWHILKGQIKPVLMHPPLAVKKLKKLFLLFKEGGLSAVRVRFFSDDFTNNYQEWVKRYDTLTEKDLAAIKAEIPKLPFKPKFSVIMPVYNVAEKWLTKAIDSVIGQVYESWELCIADDASTLPHVKRVLESYRNKDSRIKIVYREKNGHIAEASNSALDLATGDFAALVDNDDELSQHAFYMMALEINKYPNAVLLYSDEDKITSGGMRFNPYFKPDWNEELFLQQNFICHLGVYKISLLKEIGGFTKESAGAQDWDLALRVIAKAGPDKIRHLPYILYHWRVIEGSTAQSTMAKPYVLEAQKNSVINYLKNTGTDEAEVEIIPSISQLRVRFSLPKHNPLVSIIIPTKDQLSFLRRTIESIQEKTSYKNFEILVVNNSSKETATLEYFDTLRKQGIQVIDDLRPFNFSELNNGASKFANGEVLGFLNNDLEVISEDWLSEMLSSLYRPGVGAVGAKLYYPNNSIQHAGVVTGIGGIAGHSHKGRVREDPGYFNKCILTQEMSGVTAACMLIKKDVFEEVGGFDDKNLKVAFNDVDLCMKVRKAGFRIVFNPYAELFHYESISRGQENTPSKVKRFENESETMTKRWGEALTSDPFYNPNLTILTEDFALAFPPRVSKPWKR